LEPTTNDLVDFIILRIVVKRHATINQSATPKVLFTGMREVFKKEFGLIYGDYSKVYDGTDNSS
jgi:hypothetical protein